MKKLFIFLLSTVLVFSAVAVLSGCNNGDCDCATSVSCDCDVDLAPILERLGAVETQLAALQGSESTNSRDIAELFIEIGRLEGLMQGLSTSCEYSGAIATIQSSLVLLRTDLTALQNLINPPPTLNRLYFLGQTFTYVSQGLRLFSIRVEADASAMGGFVLYVTNHNMPGYTPNMFIRARRQLGGGGFASAPLPAPANSTLPMGGTVRIAIGTGFDGAYVFVGWPTDVGNSNISMIPYARFRVR